MLMGQVNLLLGQILDTFLRVDFVVDLDQLKTMLSVF